MIDIKRRVENKCRLRAVRYELDLKCATILQTGETLAPPAKTVFMAINTDSDVEETAQWLLNNGAETALMYCQHGDFWVHEIRSRKFDMSGLARDLQNQGVARMLDVGTAKAAAFLTLQAIWMPSSAPLAFGPR